MAKVYIVSLRTHDDHRPSKFIVLANNMKSAIKMAWEHGGPDFSIALRQVHWARAGNERGRATRFCDCMTVLQALAVLEVATLQCQAREIDRYS